MLLSKATYIAFKLQFFILSALAFPGNRTHDLGVASAMLYHLSYRKAFLLQRWITIIASQCVFFVFFTSALCCFIYCLNHPCRTGSVNLNHTFNRAFVERFVLLLFQAIWIFFACQIGTWAKNTLDFRHWRTGPHPETWTPLSQEVST